MKKRVKSYWVFTSTGYRIWGLVMIPILLFAATVFVFSDIAQDNSTGLYMGGSVILFYEIFSDYWIFGGICNRQMEYLKTSLMGIPLLRRALVGDLIRRLIYIMGFSVICYTKTRQIGAFCVGILIYLLAVGLLNVTRYLPGILPQMMVAFVATGILSLYGMVSVGIHGTIEELSGKIEFFHA